MADIEERAEKWARECVQAISLEPIMDKLREILAEAYLSGAAQTQADYAAIRHHCGNTSHYSSTET